MRKISFIYCFLLIAVASCTPAEITKDQQGGDDGKAEARTVIGAEIGGSVSKTTLDNPSLEASEYPVYWTQSDKININGIESNGIVISETDRRQANFSFPDPISGDMNAIYPASRVLSYSGGAASVILPSVQTYKNGDFDASTAMMVAKEQAGSNTVRFSNVMAYLQFIPGGSANNISRISVTAIGGEKMSGLFNVDFADKKLVTPSSDPEAGLISTRTASVVCDTPVSAGIPMIVAIPAQVYSKGIMVIIQDTEGHITQASNNTANLNFEKGKIYQLSGITFTPSAINADSITIDGTFTDWLTAPAVSYSLPEGAQYPDVRELKLAADDDNVYMYLELFEPDNIGGNGCRAMDIYIDADGDPSTGANLGKLDEDDYFNNAGGLEWYLEPGNLRHDTGPDYSTLEDKNMYKWCGPSGFPALGLDYLKTQKGNYGSNIEGKGDFSLASADGNGKIGRYELKLNRKYLGIFGSKAYFGVKYMLPEQVTGQGWPISGLLPQGKFNGVSRAVTDMAALALASTAYPANPITIDGNFDDWNNKNGWTSEFNLHAAATTYPELTQMKVVGTSSKVYAYFRLNYPGNTEYLPSDLILDSDGNPNTGFILNSIDNFTSGKLFDPCGATWYIEGALQDNDGVHPLNQFAMYEFTGADGASFFDSYTNHGAFDESKMKSRYKISENKDIMEIEVEFDRGTYNIKGTKVGLGFKIMHNDVKPTDNTEKVWMAHGIIPQKSTSAIFVAGDLLRVNIPPYSK